MMSVYFGCEFESGRHWNSEKKQQQHLDINLVYMEKKETTLWSGQNFKMHLLGVCDIRQRV